MPEPELPASSAVSGTLMRVESPMVGTFYRAAQPGAPPFVEIGDVVAPGQTLCILEAMKLMNEVKADVEGVVRGVHAENAEPVEFGQLLFELEPLVGRPALQMGLTEIAPGLSRWTAWRDEWREDVGCVAVDTDDGVVLIDPLDPPRELGRRALATALAG